jgi:hypothetical protein
MLFILFQSLPRHLKKPSQRKTSSDTSGPYTAGIGRLYYRVSPGIKTEIRPAFVVRGFPELSYVKMPGLLSGI